MILVWASVFFLIIRKVIIMFLQLYRSNIVYLKAVLSTVYFYLTIMRIFPQLWCKASLDGLDSSLTSKMDNGLVARRVSLWQVSKTSSIVDWNVTRKHVSCESNVKIMSKRIPTSTDALTVNSFVVQRYPTERSCFIDFLTRRRSSFERLSHATTRFSIQEPKEKSRLWSYL